MQKVEFSIRILAFILDSIIIVTLSIMGVNILADISPQLSQLQVQDYWLYYWIVQLGVALAYHYTAFSLWSASPMQHLRELILVTTKGKKPSFIQFSIRLFIKAIVVNIPIYMYVYDQDLFFFAGAIYLAILLIGSKMIYEHPRGQLLHGLMSNSYFTYLPEQES
ncbi:hypothetical protein SapgrDRAFT_3157 [Saprospira grandis DSM 2844]|uniref:RDD domain-containing protein n=1 Tax=Saprospira grandis DSM 2844 TaxID=694433 RepID=J1I8K3_9BACT|nr:RDD family protein [Saprospira grandis]EJF54803.1 hypothetical protein SapgrDRAFT_3157 [Saprospira grandis DSM 2844]